VRRRAAAALAVAAAPSGAQAHAFDPGADPWGRILEAALVPLSDPALLLALLPLGVTLGLWRADGLDRVWPALLAGLAAGVLAAPLAGLSIAVTAVLAGLAVALMGAANLPWPAWLMAGASAATGLVAGMAALEGHAPGALPVTIHLGVVLGALVAVALPFAAVARSRALVRAPWLTIGWRAASSWLAAIALMLAALRFA
jgi:hypothetical protein